MINVHQDALLLFTRVRNELSNTSLSALESCFFDWLIPDQKANSHPIEISESKHSYQLAAFGFSRYIEAPESERSVFLERIQQLSEQETLSNDRDTFIYHPLEVLGIATALSKGTNAKLQNWLLSSINSLGIEDTTLTTVLYEISKQLLSTQPGIDKENLFETISARIPIKTSGQSTSHKILLFEHELTKFTTIEKILYLFALNWVINNSITRYLNDSEEAVEIIKSQKAKIEKLSSDLSKVHSAWLRSGQKIAKFTAFSIKILLILLVILISIFTTPHISEHWDFIEPLWSTLGVTILMVTIITGVSFTKRVSNRFNKIEEDITEWYIQRSKRKARLEGR